MIETKKSSISRIRFLRQRPLSAKTSLCVCETAKKICSITWEIPLLQTSLDQNMFFFEMTEDSET